MREKVVLVGAGSVVFTRGLVADIVRRGWDADLALVDVNPEALAVAEGLVRKMIAARRAPIRLSASTDRRDVLRDATAVVCTVGVGSRRAWEKDVFIPRKYGVYQPVGDTVMPGGASRALRMIPAMVEIARDVLDLAPRALFFSYGNPMSAVCRAVRKATGAEIVGLCHGVLQGSRYLARALGVPPEALEYTAAGMNHLTWFTGVWVDGEDQMPRLRRMAARKVAQRLAARDPDACLAEAGAAGSEPAYGDEPFSWHLLHLFGAFPAVMDRHVTEFFPHLFPGGRYYGKVLGQDVFSFEEYIAGGDRGYEEMRRQAFSPDPLPGEYFESIGGEHEQVTEIIESIRRDTCAVYSANLPNRCQVPNLPAEAIVESPAVAAGGGLRAVTLPPLPTALAAIVAARLVWVETVVEAALEGSREKFIQALVMDGAVNSLEAATSLADELLEAHAAALPQFRRDAPRETG